MIGKRNPDKLTVFINDRAAAVSVVDKNRNIEGPYPAEGLNRVQVPPLHLVHSRHGEPRHEDCVQGAHGIGIPRHDGMEASAAGILYFDNRKVLPLVPVAHLRLTLERGILSLHHDTVIPVNSLAYNMEIGSDISVFTEHDAGAETHKVFPFIYIHLHRPVQKDCPDLPLGKGKGHAGHQHTDQGRCRAGKSPYTIFVAHSSSYN